MTWPNALLFISMVYRMGGYGICRSKESPAMFPPNATFAALPRSFWEIPTIVVALFLFNDRHYVRNQSVHNWGGACHSGAKSAAPDSAFISPRGAARFSDSPRVR